MNHGYFDLKSGAQVDLIHGKLDDQISIITRIVVPKNSRGQRHASKLMERVLEDADAEQVMLVLAVESYDDGLTNEQLAEWYERLGFVWMREAILELPAEVDVEPGNGLVMVRKPKGS